jgi:hypothetical protein
MILTTGFCCNKHQIYQLIYLLVQQAEQQQVKWWVTYLAHISLPTH